MRSVVAPSAILYSVRTAKGDLDKKFTSQKVHTPPLFSSLARAQPYVMSAQENLRNFLRLENNDDLVK